MSYNAAFTIAPSISPDTLILTDVSTGSDSNITGRTIGMYKADNSLYTPLLTWPPGTSAYTFTGLTSDQALKIVVTVSSSSPLAPPSSYVATQLYAATQYGEAFYYSLTQKQQSNPSILQDRSYYNNKSKLRVEIDSSNQAVSYAGDIYSSQGAIDRYTYMIKNQNNFF